MNEKYTQQGYKTWRLFAILSICFTLIISIAFSVTMSLYDDERFGYRTKLESLYSKSFYDLIYSLESIESDLDKLEVSVTKSYQSELLDSISEKAEFAENNFVQFSMADSSSASVQKMMNQLSDYATSLSKKISENGALNDDNYKTLKSFKEWTNNTLNELYITLQEVSGGEYNFVDAVNGELDGANLTVMLDGLETDSVDYPSLIYDGPFSDALTARVAKTKYNVDYNGETGLALASLYLAKLDVSDIKYVEHKNDNLPSLRYDFTTSDGETGTLQICVNGGKLLMLAINGCDGEITVGKDEMIATASSYLSECGFMNMKPVWYTDNGTYSYINFVSEIDGAKIYPEMIKVKVCAVKNKVIGIEAINYNVNYTIDRAIFAPTILEEEARSKVIDDVKITSCQLALVPTDYAGEKLCYELQAMRGNDMYFIYIDAETGEERKILKVIDTYNGQLLR